LTTSEKDQLILSEQTRLIFNALPFSLAASTFNACVLVYILRNEFQDNVLISWLAVLLLSMLLRFFIFIAYRIEKPIPQSDKRWDYTNNIGVLLSSMAWGSCNIFLFPETSVVHQAFLAFVIAGMSAGGVSTLSYSRRAILIFLVCMLPILSIRFFMLDTEMGYAMGTMIALYFFVLVGVAQNSYKSMRQNIELRLDTEIQKKELKESEEKYFRIFESSPLGIIHFNRDGSIVAGNNILYELFAMDSTALSNVNLLEMKRDTNFNKAIRFSLKGNATQYEGSTAAINKEVDTPVRIYFRDIKDLEGKVAGGVAIVEDKTEDKRVEKLKSQFISTVSHELRTPLTAIAGVVGLIKNARTKISDAEFSSLLENIERNSQRLILLVNDILDIEKMATGQVKFTFEQLPLTELLTQSVNDNQPYADEFDVTLDLINRQCDEINVNVNRQRFLQVMANLISNAAKFSPPNSHVEVGVTNLVDSVRIYVKDFGEGIEDDFKDKVFEKFTQQDSSDTRRVGGTGLGLSISKEIVEQMGGHIDYVSHRNKGSVFFFELPKA